jgi:DNA-binding transcriptional MerR regulator
MKDLCELTGLERQAIHFYIQEGLVPEGRKTGRNMAFYGDVHLERIRLIKRLQREQFLPLRAIKAVLDGEESGFEPDQQALLLEVKRRLDGKPVVAPRAEAVPVEALLVRHGLERRDLDELEAAGLVAVGRSGGHKGGKLGRISADDAWQLELLGEMRRAGFTRELGFTAKDMALYAEAIDRLFVDERQMLLARLGHLAPEAIATRVERALPIIGSLLARYHTARAHQFFATLGEPAAGRRTKPTPPAKSSLDRAERRSGARARKPRHLAQGGT